jgi:hypothetical protein
MAEQVSTTPRYLNQFKDRNIIKGTTIITNMNIPPNMMEMVENAANLLYNLTSSVLYISQSLTTQSVQIENLSSTANSFNPNKIFVNKETPSGSINGVNTTYTLENIPSAGSEHLYLNGLLIEEGSFTDYTISSSIITFSEPLLSGMKLHCTYYYVDPTPVKVFKDKEILSGSIDGINKTFTLQYTPVEDSEHIYLNGLLQESGVNGDYEISDSTITFKEAPPTNTNLRGTYYHML